MAKAAAKKAPQDEVEIFDVEQRSDAWIKLRLGLMTASRFATIMASGKDGGPSIGRARLMRQLAGEILTGHGAETYQNAAMLRGIAMEEEARDYYARRTFEPMARVGFVRRTIPNPLGDPLIIGASPDSFVGTKRMLEIKTMIPELLIEVALKGAAGLPPEHKAQCQGGMWAAGREECDLMLFYSGMPVAPTFLIHRDDRYIRGIQDACERFDWELKQLVNTIKAMGR